MLWALDADTGEVVWSTRMRAGTNATVAVAGDTLITAASFPQGAGQRAEIVAYRIGATGAPESGSGTQLAGGERAGSERAGGEGRETERRARTTTPREGGQPSQGADVAEGRTLFTQQCAGCHTLADAGASGTVGPNLDDLRPSQETTDAQVTNGGGGMPAFGGRLSREQIANISAYVAQAAGQGGGGGGGGGGGTP
jgi:cytochrome c553